MMDFTKKTETYDVLTRRPPRDFLEDLGFVGVAARELRADDNGSKSARKDDAVGELASSNSS